VIYLHLNIKVNSLEETLELGRKIGSAVNANDIICLNGGLGTGKTHLTKGIAEGLGIKDNITSPTFTIVNEYIGRLKLYHFDVYRVNDPDEIYNIGFDEYIFGDGVCVIEWSDYIKELIPAQYLSIDIKKDSVTNINSREIIINSYGERYDYIWRHLL
jgi:tRNA threonylcarbamoyladenosine biosynthesis protein TsaE